MTDATLKKHIKTYKEISEQIKALEAVQTKEREAIIGEFTSRDVKKALGMQVVAFDKETMSKKDTPPAIWDKFKKTYPVVQLRSCRG